MSKQIKPGRKLSKFDAQYLRDRGQDPAEFIVDPDAEQEETDEEPAESTDTSDGTAQNRGNKNPAILTEQDSEDDEDGDEEEPYSEWSNDELRAEIKNRNDGREDEAKISPTSDRKADLVKALEADDEVSEGDDEESAD